MSGEDLAQRAAALVRELIAEAERRAEEIVREARREAAEIRGRAEAEAAELRDRAEASAAEPAPGRREEEEEEEAGAAASEPASASEPPSGSEPEPEPGATTERSGLSEQGARLIAMKMALDGATRDQIVASLDPGLPPATREAIADDVLARAAR